MAKKQDRGITITEASGILRTSRAKVIQLLHTGRLISVRYGFKCLLSQKQVGTLSKTKWR